MSQVSSRGSVAVRAGWLWLTLVIVSTLGSWLVSPAPIQAQEGEQAKAAAPAAPSAPAEPEKKSALQWWYTALGWRYTTVFLFLSFSLVALFVMNVLAAQRSAICPMPLIEGFEGMLNEKRYQDAYELAKNDDSFLGRVLAAGLGKVSAGYAKAIEAMQEVGEDETMKIEHRLSYISLIGSISTMFGLLGTVDGMIQSFIVIAESPTTPKPSELAQGISMAMMTTLVGLMLAIPAICTFTILRNRLQRLTLEAGIASEGLMSRFESVENKSRQP